jgi:hypothetical protein
MQHACGKKYIEHFAGNPQGKIIVDKLRHMCENESKIDPRVILV